MKKHSWFIGWDVGAWHCDSGNSRDAIVILTPDNSIVGTPWRGNLRQHINQCSTTDQWVKKLFSLCKCNDKWSGSGNVTLAIDAPLGFSDAFLKLVTQSKVADAHVRDFKTNPYLFRRTERFLFERELRPLSAVQDQLGSQATKGIHVRASFAPELVSCGVWKGGSSLTIIEAYPSACNESRIIQELREQCLTPEFGQQDYHDALTCAFVARLFTMQRQALLSPEEIPACEGWIWVPNDALGLD